MPACITLTRQDKYTAESARLHDEMRRQLDKIEDLVEQICGMAQDSRGSMNCWCFHQND